MKKKQINNNKKIDDLEKRVALLEKIVSGMTYNLYQTLPAPYHFHNGMPCYQNPCIWC